MTCAIIRFHLYSIDFRIEFNVGGGAAGAAGCGVGAGCAVVLNYKWWWFDGADAKEKRFSSQ